MGKREMIERVLKNTIGRACLEAGFPSATLAGILTIAREILAEKAIVIECEVGHDGAGSLDEWTTIYDISDGEVAFAQRGIHGTPGKAMAIIVQFPSGG